MKLLNIDANAKTIKGQKLGYMTAVMYLAPYKSAGINVCPMAELASCHIGCLNTAGRGGISADSRTIAPYGIPLPDNAIQAARVARTRLYVDDKPEFMALLVKEIDSFVQKAKRKKLIPCVRLNGTSDIAWENYGLFNDPICSVFELFPDIQFYDYTKIAKRCTAVQPANYHLSWSYSGASSRYAAMAPRSANWVVVFRSAELPKTFKGRAVINGDETDLRFLDPRGVVVGLKAKGAARRDKSGFVVDAIPRQHVA